MMRLVLILHRYAGVIVGLMMTLWCLSGFVMMYQSFPELSPSDRLAGLEPLTACCDLANLPIADEAEVSDARIEMAAGSPILRLSGPDGPPRRFNLATHARQGEFTEAETLAVAAAFGRRTGVAGAPRALGLIAQDQWTVQTAGRNRPVHHFAFDDPARTQVYVSGKSGEVFQRTTRRERVLSWMGAIPHWLYPTALRQDPPLWSQVVVWTSTLGVFLTVTGLYVGISRLGKGRGGRLSPYQGLWFWHHMTGLVFGVLTLTWVASGLLTMNPWGLLESGAGSLRGKLAGHATWSEMRKALESAPASAMAVQISAAPWAGEARLLATTPDGKARRFDAAGREAPVGRAEIERGFALAHAPLAGLDLIAREDAYYYGHHGEVALPAWRARLADQDGTRVYIDPQTGRVARVVDAASRGSRWLSSAWHDFDWPVIRRRPVWDLVVLPLLLGVTASCGIGTWMGFSRIGRDLRALRRLPSRRKA